MLRAENANHFENDFEHLCSLFDSSVSRIGASADGM